MSSVQAIGRVLEAFPLVISALEKYGSASGNVRTQYPNTLDFASKIRLRQAEFKNAIDTLLRDAGVDDVRAREVVDGFEGAYWWVADLEAHLRAHLGDRHQMLVTSLESISTTLGQARSSLETASEHRAADNPATIRRIKRAFVDRDRVLQGSFVEGRRQMQILDHLNALQLNLIGLTLTVSIVAGEQENIDIDCASLNTEPESEGYKLPFLSVLMSKPKGKALYSSKDGIAALLDTGATACCISEAFAMQHNLEAEPASDSVGLTGASAITLFTKGKTKLEIRWHDRNGEVHGSKWEFFVVADLYLPVILSQAFVQKYPHAWDLRNMVDVATDRLFVIGFSKMDKTKRSLEDKFRQDRSKSNHDEDEEARRRERAHLESSLGYTSVSSAGGSSQSIASSQSTVPAAGGSQMSTTSSSKSS